MEQELVKRGKYFVVIKEVREALLELAERFFGAYRDFYGHTLVMR